MTSGWFDRLRATLGGRGRVDGTAGWSQSFQVTVATRTDAEGVAAALAARGHELVAIREVDHFLKDPNRHSFGKPSLRPEEQGQWDVFSLATSQAPDGDREWWDAQEEAAVRRLAERFGGRTGGGAYGATDRMFRMFTREGLVHELDRATATTRRMAALAEAPGRAGERESRTVDEDVRAQAGRPITVGGIDDVEWTKLEHAYGPASDVPGMLRGLAANDKQWDEVHGDFVGSVLHQGSIYSASAPALGFLTELASSPELAPRRRLDLLYTLFLAGSAWDQATAYGYRPDRHAGDVRETVVRATGRLLELWPSATRPEQRLLLLLAALADLEVPPTDLDDPASRLAVAMTRDHELAEAVLEDLASRHEDLVELAESEGPLPPRLVAALERLLWEP